jgi:hypothetical protein
MAEDIEATMTANDDLPPCMIFIDKEGRWFHKGAEMIHRDTILLFYQHMSLDSQGRYVITLEGERCYVEAEDTPFIVRRARFTDSVRADRSGYILSLNDGTEENLSPETLTVGADNVLYCKVKEYTFPARFDRPAYYQLAQHIEEREGVYFLPLNGKDYLIRNKNEGPTILQEMD